eukprot:8100584-Ditylum_brightwellii.AAC.1
MDTCQKLMDGTTNQFEVMVSNHLGWKGIIDIMNKEFHGMEDFLFIEEFEWVFKDEVGDPANESDAVSVPPYGSVGNVDNVIMECGTKEAGTRQERSVAFGFRKGCHFAISSNRVATSISDTQD